MIQARCTLVRIWIFLVAMLPAMSAHAFRIVSFDGTFTRWHTNEVPYTLDIKGSDNFDEDGCDMAGKCVSVAKAIEKSFRSWENLSNTEIRFKKTGSENVTSTGYDQKNHLLWIESGWTQQSFSPPASALAVTISTYKTKSKEIVDSDIFFNGEHFEWAVINSDEERYAGVVDIENIATHEIGHFVGLDHSSEDLFEPLESLYFATMFFASGPGEIFRRNLNTDDHNAILNLYPSFDAGDPEVESIYPEAVDLQSTSVVNLVVRGANFHDHTTVQLVRKNEGDLIGTVHVIDETHLEASFNLAYMPSGEYDLVVSNAFDRRERISKGLLVLGGYGHISDNVSDSSDSGGGCSVSNQKNYSNAEKISRSLLFILPILLILLARLELSPRALRRKLQAFARIPRVQKRK